jgi:serine/threonine-protein kinase
VAVDGTGTIYVPHRSPGSGSVTTYNADGTQTTPTITGLSTPDAVAVDAAGKIYVANAGNGTVTTYNADGSASTPTITGLSSPSGVAVDGAGKIYVTNSGNGTVTTYNADGSASTPTIVTGLNGLVGIAVH